MPRRGVLLAVVALLVGAGIGAGALLLTRASGSVRAVEKTRRPPERFRKQTPPAPSVLRLSASAPGGTLTLPILMYHRIDALAPSLVPITRRLTVAPADFAAQMRWLKRHGFHAVSQLQAFDALERGGHLPAKPIMITFDDGYRDVYKNALPVLVRLRIPATAYVITGRIGGPDPSFLTWGELRILERGGVAIGSHTVTHADLTALDDAHALAELRDSRAILQRRLHHPVQWFAYPYGAEDARVVALARRAGYVLAVTTRPGDTQSAATPLELRRDEILDTTGVSGLAALLRVP